MLNDNLLENRLNAVKKGQPIPKPISPIEAFLKKLPPQKASLRDILISKFLFLFDIFIASFLYGLAINTVFSLKWDFLGCLAVGFLLNHIITVFPRVLFPKLYK
jgi:hypothetical protein